MKMENDTLKNDRIFSQMRKMEHSHFVRENELREEIERELKKREEWKTQMETRIRVLKDEHDAVRAAHKLIHEKREQKLKNHIRQAKKIIKGLKEDKKRLRKDKTMSQLIEGKLRHEIVDLETAAQKGRQGARAKLERWVRDMRGAEESIRKLRNHNQQLQDQMKSNQSDAAKRIEDLEAKLKQAESDTRRLGEALQQQMQNGASEQGNGVKIEKPKEEESSLLTSKVTELESKVIKSQESLLLMSQLRDAAVRRGIELELEHSYNVNLMTSNQTDPSDFGSNSVQMSKMEVELFNLLSPEQIAKLNDIVAKVQQELRGEK